MKIQFQEPEEKFQLVKCFLFNHGDQFLLPEAMQISYIISSTIKMRLGSTPIAPILKNLSQNDLRYSLTRWPSHSMCSNIKSWHTRPHYLPWSAVEGREVKYTSGFRILLQTCLCTESFNTQNTHTPYPHTNSVKNCYL